MTGFAGTGQLSKLAFRRDGVALPACVFGIAALLAITARDLTVRYPTAASRLAVATRASANPALRFLLGRLNTPGPMKRPGGLSWLARPRWGGRRRSPRRSWLPRRPAWR